MVTASLVVGILGPVGSASAQTPVPATLVQTIQTSQWSPASPDPSGVTYLPDSDTLLVVDSEVDEETGAGYHGVNIWEVTRTGAVVRTGTTLPWSDEPTGVEKGPGSQVFIASDDDSSVFIVEPGPDDTYGTGDDVHVGAIDMGDLGAEDTEDPAYVPSTGHLYVLDGAATDIYQIDPVNGVFGDADDIVTSFDVGVLGSDDYEGLAYDEDRNTLLLGARVDDMIFEITLAGQLVRAIDAGVAGLSRISGLGVAPASDGSGETHYWIVDRQVDNDSDPDENDGMMFEISVPEGGGEEPPGPNQPPVFDQDLQDRSDAEGTMVDFSAGATDPDEDELTYEATGLPPGVTIDPGTGQISGTIDPGAATGSPYDVEIVVRDGPLPGPAEPIELVQSNVGAADPVTELQVDYLSPPTEGNLLIAAGAVQPAAPITLPAGWDEAIIVEGTSRAFAYYKVAGPAEPSTVTVTRPDANRMAFTIFEYSGLDDVQGEVLDRTVSNIVSGVNEISTGTTQVTSQSNELLLAAVGLGATRPFSNTWTNGFTQRSAMARHTTADRIVSSTDQFETTESWGNTATGGSALMVTFKGADPGNDTLTASDAFTWTVTEPDSPPIIDSVSIDQADPATDDTLTVSVAAHDPDDDPITLEYQWTKNEVDLPGETSETLDLSVAGNGDRGDEISVRVTASDGTNLSDPVTSDPVSVINTAPVFDQDLPDRTDVEGDMVDFSAGATDLDDDALLYEATGLPPGISIDPGTGQISGTIDPDAATGGPYNVEVTVRDGPGGEPPPPIELLQSNAVAGDLAVAEVSYPDQPTEGNLLVALAFTGGNRTYAMPDGWQPAVERVGPVPQALAFYKVAGPAEPSTVTLTIAGTAANAALSIYEYAGLHGAQSDVLDRTTSDRQTDVTSISTGTTETTTQANELLIAAVNLAAGRTFQNTWTNGFERLVEVTRHTTAHRVVSETGEFETTESWTRATEPQTTSASALMVTFKGAEPVSDTLTDVDSFTWTVVPANSPPVINSVTIDQAAPATNDILSATVDATDPDDDPIAFEYQWIKNGVDLSGETSATLDLSAPGNGDKGDEVSVRVTASDGVDPSAPVTSDAVTIVNTEPTFDQDLPDRTDDEGDFVSISAAATDADADALTYEATGLPGGLTIDPATGLISGTIAFTAAAGSPFSVEVTVRDGPDLDATDLFTWTVNDVNRAPMLAAIGNQSLAEGDTENVPISAVDPDADPLTFNVNAEAPAWATLTDHADGTATLALAPGFEDEGEYDLTVTVSDGDLTDEETFTVTVTGTNQNPTFDQDIGDRTDDEGAFVTIDAGATDPDGDPLVYEATGLPDGIIIDDDTAEISGTIAFTAAAGSPYSVEVTVRDGSLVDDTDTFTWTVTNVNRSPTLGPIGDQEVAEGDTENVPISAIDPDGGPLSFSLDPGAPAWATLTDHADGTATLALAPGFEDEGEYDLTVTVSDGDLTDDETFTVEVTGTNQNPIFDQDLGDRTDDEGAFVTIDAGATDPDGDPLTYEATGLPDNVTIDPTTGLISGTIAFTAADDSPYSVELTVRDGGTVDDTDTFKWTVTNVNRAPTFLQDLGNRSDLEGAEISIDAGAADPDDDTLTYDATGLPGGIGIDPDTGEISGTIAFDAVDDSPYAVEVTVTDGDLVDTDQFTWTITESAAPGETVTTGDEASVADPLVTSVTTPNTGPVEIVEGPVTEDPPAGFTLLGQQVDITAPSASAQDPLVLVFRLDASFIPDGEDETTIHVLRDGVPVPACGDQSGEADPDPCVSDRSRLADGDVSITVLTSEASRWTFAVGAPLRAKQLKKATKNEGDRGKRALVFRVRLRAPADSVGSVRFRTIQKTAKAGKDFVMRKGRIVFRPGDRVAKIRVNIKGDRIPERKERFLLRLFKPQNVVLAKAQAVGVIIDDD